jgi:hypothetical protein
MEIFEKTEEAEPQLTPAEVERLGKVASDEEWDGLIKTEQRAYVNTFNGCKR